MEDVIDEAHAFGAGLEHGDPSAHAVALRAFSDAFLNDLHRLARDLLDSWSGRPRLADLRERSLAERDDKPEAAPRPLASATIQMESGTGRDP